MKYSRLLSLAGLCTAFFTLVPATPTWKPLFNGKSIRPDWRFIGDSTFWTIDPKDTSLVGFSPTTNTPHALLVSTKADYDQFTVKYSYRLKTGCSGFWFRTRGTTPENVEGPQVEIKREGNQLLEVGSIYVWPQPGWTVQHSAAYSVKTAAKVDEYQDVILTVKNPNLYVNVNGSQSIGETDAALITAGTKPAWNYTASTYVQKPGSFALQVHKDYAIDVRFKNIMILAGCGDKTSPNYDGDFVPGFPKQAAVYQEDGSCVTSGAKDAAQEKLASYLGAPQRRGAGVAFEVSYPGANSLEVSGLDGRSLFSGSAPGATVYSLSSLKPGLYLARLAAGGRGAWRRVLVP